MEGRTCLLIAHRLDTLNSCQRLLVFDKGEVVEEGPFNELFAKKGHFYKLHNAEQIHQV